MSHFKFEIRSFHMFLSWNPSTTQTLKLRASEHTLDVGLIIYMLFKHYSNYPIIAMVSPCASAVFLAFACLAVFPTCLCQIIYNADPSVNWATRVNQVTRGNGVYLSPDEKLVISSSADGAVTALSSSDGTELWTFSPFFDDTTVLSCSSGITFVHGGTTEYMIYSVIVHQNFSSDAISVVVALSMLGNLLWMSQILIGVASGTPVASGDGAYVFLTHNSVGGNIGHFSIISAGSGEIFFTQAAEAPFAPPGIYHSPAEGYYDGGEHNTNDILVWSVQPRPDDETVGPGMIFAFQFPTTFVGQPNDLEYIVLGTEERDFQAIQKPVFANEGRSLYWGTSRSQFRCWLGQEGLNRYRFSRPTTNNVGFNRGSPPSQAVFAPLALTHNKTNLLLFGGSAANEFVRLNEDFSNQVVIATSAIITAEARVSPDDAYVYYVEFGGRLHQASTEDLMDNWVYNIQVPVQGEFTLNKDGTIIYIGDISGTIHSLQVAELPSESPTATPSRVPSTSPTPNPSAMPSLAPSLKPSLAPSLKPSVYPSENVLSPAPSVVFVSTSQPVTLEPSASEESSDEEVGPGDLDVDLSQRSTSTHIRPLVPLIAVIASSMVSMCWMILDDLVVWN